MKIYEIGYAQYWYDKSTRCWWTAIFQDGDQLSDADNAYTKEEIVEIAKDLDSRYRDEFGK